MHRIHLSKGDVSEEKRLHPIQYFLADTAFRLIKRLYNSVVQPIVCIGVSVRQAIILAVLLSVAACIDYYTVKLTALESIISDTGNAGWNSDIGHSAVVESIVSNNCNIV